MKPHRRVSLLLVLAVLLIPSAAYCQQTGGEDYEEVLLFVDARDKKITVQHLDGTRSAYDLPVPLSHTIADYDVSVWGRIIYADYYYERPISEERILFSRDDGRFPVLHVGFVSNAFKDLVLHQIAVSPDGNKLAITAKRRGEEGRTKTALFIMDLTTGRMAQLTPFDHVARGPAWSPSGAKLAFFLGKQPQLSEDENAMILSVVEEPLASKPQIREVSPPMPTQGYGTGLIRPTWAHGEKAIYFTGMYDEHRKPGLAWNIYRVNLESGKLEVVGPGIRPVSDLKGSCVLYEGMPYGAPIQIVEGIGEGPRPYMGLVPGLPSISPSGRYITYYDEVEKKQKIIEKETKKVILVADWARGDRVWIRMWPLLKTTNP